MSRQTKDHDIARMNALTNAVNFLSAFQDKLENQTEISDLVLKLANKFSTWILDGNGDAVQRETERIKEELGTAEDGTKPYRDTRSGKMTNVHQSNGENLPITKKQYGYLVGLLRERGYEVNYEELDQLTVSEASDWISDLKDADMRDRIKDPIQRQRAHRSAGNNGRGNGKAVLKEVKEQIKERGLSHTLVS